jgi:hypothetical protein
MKKLIPILLLIIAASACKSKSTGSATKVKNEPVANTKLDRSAQTTIKGNWVITSVSFPGSKIIAVKSFQIADSKCFVGSTWNFISNNNKGSMKLTKSDCITFESPIVWSVNKDGIFVLKIVEAGTKAKAVTQGFMLRLTTQSENSFQLIDTVDIAGKMTEITYQFEKSTN